MVPVKAPESIRRANSCQMLVAMPWQR
jgi:hypothetical protein